MDEKALLERITVNPAIFAGKPIIRGRRLAVEHVLGMLAAGDTPETVLFEGCQGDSRITGSGAALSSAILARTGRGGGGAFPFSA